MTKLQFLLSRLTELHEKASSVPWRKEGCELYFHNTGQQFAYDKQKENAELIAESRNALPLLLQIIRMQQEALEQLSGIEIYFEQNGKMYDPSLGTDRTSHQHQGILSPAKECLAKIEELIS